MAALCVITDFMGDDAELETAMLHEAGIDAFVSPSPDPGAWVDRARHADAVLTRHAPIRASTIDQMQRCRIIARYGTGHDNVDLPAALRRGIVVTTVVDYCTDEVADHTMALILALARALPGMMKATRAGGWTPQPIPPVVRLAGRWLGLVGCGRIGAAVAHRATAFGMAVAAFDPHAPELPVGVARAGTLEELLRRSDVVSLHAPLTDETAGIIDTAALGLLPVGAIVVNVARGGLVDLDAAMAAVVAGRLGGLGLDVVAAEPPPRDHPARNHPRVILTPHVGYYSNESVIEAKRRSTGEVVRVLQGGLPENPVRIPGQGEHT